MYQTHIANIDMLKHGWFKCGQRHIAAAIGQFDGAVSMNLWKLKRDTFNIVCIEFNLTVE